MNDFFSSEEYRQVRDARRAKDRMALSVPRANVPREVNAILREAERVVCIIKDIADRGYEPFRGIQKLFPWEALHVMADHVESLAQSEDGS